MQKNLAKDPEYGESPEKKAKNRAP